MIKKLHPIHRLKKRPRRPQPGPLRRGSVLIVVLVLILLLTYGVYGFTARMLAEVQAADAHGRAVQAVAFAESGIEVAASAVTTRAADPANPVSLYHRPDLFGGIVMKESTVATAIGRFSLVAPVEGDATYRQVRFGLADESGKLNINSIAAMELDALQQQMMLMSIPGMTEEIADAILDYVDEDEEVRPLGAESEYYQTLIPPAYPKNGPLDSLDELLLVRGVTPELLYGEDANRNGLLDPSENDGAASQPTDDADGFLASGWAAYLTVHSRESNLRPDGITNADGSVTAGSPKININQGLLTDLYDAIIAAIDDEEAARFIVAYRMYGPNEGDAAASSDGSSSTSSGSESSEGSEGDDSEDANSQSDQVDQLAGNIAKAIGGSSEDGQTTRGGLDLSPGAKYEIVSLYELIERAVDVPENEEIGQAAETIASPWSSGNLAVDFPELHNLFAISDGSSLEGRINVNEAPYEVLLGVPEMTPQIADAIIANRVGPGGQPLEQNPERQTTAWLVTNGIVDLPMMKKLDPYLTGRGDVFKVQSVGFFDGGGPAARIEAIIDGTVKPAKVVQYRDLTHLGRGYPPAQLRPNTTQTSP